MSSAFPPADEGEETHASALPKPIRLSEVPLIAERSEGGVDGALKEAFALRPADAPDAPEPAVTDRAEADRGETEPAHVSAESVPAKPAPIPAGPPEAASVESQHPAEGVETRPAVEQRAESAAGEPAAAVVTDASAELAPAAIGDATEAPTVAAPPLPTDTIETQARPADDSSETGRPLASALADAHVPSFTPDTGEPAADGVLPAPPPVAPPLFHAEPVARSFAGMFPAEPDSAANRPEHSFGSPTAPERVVDDSEAPATGRPLASALDTAAKLAADANAAAEALENLKRLLDRELPNAAQAPRQPLHEIFAEARASHEPPPLPAHEPPLEHPADEEPPSPEPKPFRRPGAGNAPWRERRQFDVRGFLAGFALSWAIGAALYIYLTAG